MRFQFGLAILTVCLLQTLHCLPVEDSNVKPLSAENIERLLHLGKDDRAWEHSGQFQGDMIMTPEQLKEYYPEDNKAKTGLVNTNSRWPDNTVPVLIVDGYFDQAQIDYIHLGLEKIEEVTCIKFVAYDPAIHTNYVAVTGEASGCWSYVGNLRRGRQDLNLQLFAPELGCFRLYTIVHEFLHALGFHHMQSATERDEYVMIVWDKIQSGTQSNFNSYSANSITNFGVEYDYGSVMHYGPTAFSIDGSNTILNLKPLNGETMGQQYKISDGDIERVNRMYCNEPTTEAPPSTSVSTTVTAAPSTTTTSPPTVTTSTTTAAATTSTTTTETPGSPPSIFEWLRSLNIFMSNLFSNIFGNIFGKF